MRFKEASATFSGDKKCLRDLGVGQEELLDRFWR